MVSNMYTEGNEDNKSSSTAQATAIPKGMSLPRALLHLEGLVVFVGALLLYGHISGNWLVFVLLLFIPDVSMIGYLVSARLGSITYNLIHTYTLPLGLALVMLAIESNTGLALMLVWLAHIGMDRTVGYGLKYAAGFKSTHLNYV